VGIREVEGRGRESEIGQISDDAALRQWDPPYGCRGGDDPVLLREIGPYEDVDDFELIVAGKSFLTQCA